MSTAKHESAKPGGARLPTGRSVATLLGLLLFALWLLTSVTHAATFSGNASISANDSTNALSANPANNLLTVSCWFKLVVPSGTNITENMTILMDRVDGNEAANFSYLLRFNATTGVIEFLTRGASGAYTNTLIARPYLDRWYHVAVVRQNNLYYSYVDGRALSPDAGFVGSAVGGGLSIGGIGGNSRNFRGEIIEVAVYRAFLDADTIRQRMFRDQRTFANLAGYYKLGYSTNAADLYRNFVPVPPQGTDLATKQGPGTIEFEETDQAGEQSTFDSRKNHGQDALTPLSGAFGWSQTAFARPVPGIAFDLRFGYSSGTPTFPPTDGGIDPYNPRVLGVGWRQAFDTRIFTETSLTEFKLLTWEGSIETWTRTNSSAPLRTRHNEYRGELVETNGGFEWTTPERLVYRFQDPTDGTLMAGRLREIRDFNGNAVSLFWNQDEGYVTNLVDTAGGRYVFNFDTAQKLLTNVSFGLWQVNFGYDSSNRLASKSLTNTSGLYTPVNTTWQFRYNTNGLLSQIVDPRGTTNLFVQYDQYGRQTNQVDALSRATATRYGIPGKRQITRIDPGANSWIETYDRKGHILAQQDPLTNITSYTYDTNGNRISVTEPLGWKTTFGYDTRANVVARTNALGEITRWTYHGFFNRATNEVNAANWTNSYFLDNATGNLLRHYDELGTLVTYTYRPNGLVDNSTDGNGGVTQFNYDTNGFLISRIDPGTNTWTYAPNEVGWKLSESNPLGEVTRYTYNLNGQIVETIDPLFRHFTKTYDPNGNLLSESDGKGQLTAYAYDPANQRTNMVDRTGTNKWTYAYTTRGKPASTTDPQSNSVTQIYDVANRLVAVTDPLNSSITNLYDANGNLTVLIDKVGQRWTKTYDRLNRVTTEANPQGDTRQTTYDEVGRIKVVTTPNGYPSTRTYDGRGRLTNWKDAEGFEWQYAYDGNANITNITDALNGKYVMTYGPRNERLSELNQDSNRWTYVYDELLRLKQQTDPNGTTRTLDYDQGGRVLSVQFSTGRKNSMTYDDNNNVRVMTRRIGLQNTTTQLAYDPLDRVTEQTDAFQKTIRYGYDSLGRITSLTYPDNRILTQRFDPLGRLTNQTDWVGRQMTYEYDKASRLVRRKYPNGIVQTNTFNDAGRITGLSYSPSTVSSNSINIALSYAYDRNGNKVGGGEKGTLQWPLPSLTDETARFTPGGKLIDRQIENTTSNQFSTINYLYDPSGNMTNATGGGQSWCLTYDEDNRTTSIKWDCGMSAKIITNRYDALGRRISRRVVDDGIETRYVLDLAGSMERILCDTDDAGNITAWYIHGPDLAYKVNNTNGLTCFHADAQANIVALTDGNTNLVAQYAYTPYGRSLGASVSSNLQSQIQNPYLFVGSQGVMEELPGLYFMRARYYSAEAGVFLSTDPVRKIGPGWRPIAYGYANANSLTYADPDGEFAHVLAAIGIGAVWGFGTDVLFQFAANGWDGIDWRHAVMKGAFGGAKGGLLALAGPLGFVGGTVLNGAFDYLENGVENAYYGRSFNQDAGSALVRSAVSSSLAKGFEKIVDVNVKNPVGRPVPTDSAYDNYLSGKAGPNSQFTVRLDVSKGLAKESVSTVADEGQSFVGSFLGGGNAPSGNSSISSLTAGAGAFGNLMTGINGTQTAPSSSGVAGTTPMLGGNALANLGNSSTASATSTQTTLSSTSTSTSSTSSSSGGFWGWLFGGGKKK